MEDDYDMIFKIVLIGDSGVGKSNILSRYLKDEFSFETKTTVGVEFGAKKIEINNMKIKAQIWDTAGQERYKSITNAYYKGSKGALVVYDITRPETFDNVDRWIMELKKNADPDVAILIVGNKSDLENERQVSTETAQIKAADQGVAFMETSAYQSVNIDKAFHTMIEEIYKKYNKLFADADDEYLENSENVIELNNSNTPKKKKKCC